MEIHQGTGSDTNKIWRSVETSRACLRYRGDLAKIWRSGDLGIHQGAGSDTQKIWRSGDPPGDWLRYEGDREIVRLAPLPRRSGDLEVHQGTGSATKEILRS